MDDRNETTQQRHLQAGYRRDSPRPRHHRRHPLTTSSQETQIRQGQGQDQRQGQRQDQEQIPHVAAPIQTTTLHQCITPYSHLPSHTSDSATSILIWAATTAFHILSTLRQGTTQRQEEQAINIHQRRRQATTKIGTAQRLEGSSPAS